MYDYIHVTCVCVLLIQALFINDEHDVKLVVLQETNTVSVCQDCVVHVCIIYYCLIVIV